LDVNDVSKLPKWARQHIELLTRQRDEAKRQIEQLVEHPATNVVVEPYGRDYNREPRFVPDDSSIRFMLGSPWQYIDVRRSHDGEAIELMASSALCARLASSNVIYFKVER
jgi:hypothetical protein